MLAAAARGDLLGEDAIRGRALVGGGDEVVVVAEEVFFVKKFLIEPFFFLAGGSTAFVLGSTVVVGGGGEGSLRPASLPDVGSITTITNNRKSTTW